MAVVSAGSAGVLLIDLENMIGTKARPKTLVPRLDAIIQQAGPGMLIVAACAGSRITAEGIVILQERDAKLLKVKGTKDAADQALLDEAHRLAQLGYRRFVVASGDGAFGKIADLGDLEIVIWQTQPARKKGYSGRATKTHRIADPIAVTTTKVTVVAPAQVTSISPKISKITPVRSRPALAPVAVSISTATTNSEKPKDSTPPMIPTESEPPLSQGWVGSAATELSRPLSRSTIPKLASEVGIGLLGAGAIFAVGVVFGAGTAVGAETVRHVLRRP